MWRLVSLLIALITTTAVGAQTAPGSNQDIAADLESLLSGCRQPGPIIEYLKLRRSHMRDRPGTPPIPPGTATSDVLYPRDVTWRGLQVELIQYEQRQNDRQWRILVQFQVADDKVAQAFYEPLNASRRMIAKDTGLETGFLQFNGKTSVICQNTRGPWMVTPAQPGGPNLLELPSPQAAPAEAFQHPAVLAVDEVKDIAAWTARQWASFMGPLLQAGRGRLDCRPPQFLHSFIPPPYDKLITDHSVLCEP